MIGTSQNESNRSQYAQLNTPKSLGLDKRNVSDEMLIVSSIGKQLIKLRFIRLISDLDKTRSTDARAKLIRFNVSLSYQFVPLRHIDMDEFVELLSATANGFHTQGNEAGFDIWLCKDLINLGIEFSDDRNR